MSKLVMALDQGTTSSRTILFDETGALLCSENELFPSTYPKSGWVEQDPEVIWSSQLNTMKKVLEKSGHSLKDIAGLGITNQRETVIAWNKDTGEALGNAIVWQCRRTADYCEILKKEGFDQVIKEHTGLVTDAYFSGTKMRWILNEVPGAHQLAAQGKLAFGTVDSWLIWKLTGGKVHIMDITNASRTLVYNVFKREWDEEILKHFDIPIQTLPEVKPSSGIVGHTDPSIFGASIPIAGIAGDQHASLFGQACFETGMAKNTYGTGCFMLMNTGDTPILSQHNLLTTVAWQIGDQVTYAIEGSIFIAGALIQWLRDELELFQDASETEAMATSVDHSNGAYVVPAFVGLGAPHWDPYARGTIMGLTRNTNKRHIVRAALEAIAFQAYDIAHVMELDTKIALNSLRMDGGASNNNFLCQFQSDILGMPASRPKVVETTAMGAAFLAGLATGVWSGTDEIQKMWQEDRRFTPQISKGQADDLLKGWHRAVERSKGWES